MSTRDIAILGLSVDARQVKDGDRALDNFERTARRTESSTDKLTKTQERLARAMKGVVAALAVREIAELAKQLYEAAAAADRLNLAYKFSFGATAAKELQFVRKLAYDLGLEFQTTATAYGKLSAAARGTALAGEGAQQIFIAVSKASAVMGLSADQTAGALTALEQMISKGTVSSEELKGQLGERLPGAFQIAARAMGKTTQELQKMLEAGEVLAEDFLPKFAKRLETEIGDAADKAADRLDAATNRMGDAFKRLMTAAAESGIAQFLKDLAQGAANDMTAIAEAMERAKAGGSGTLMQWNAGAGMAIGRTLGLQNFSDDFKTLDGQLKSALATVERLDAKPKLSLWEQSDLANARKRIDNLTEYKRLREGAANDMNAQDSRMLAMGAEQQKQVEAAKRAEGELADVRRKLYGVDKDYLPTLEKLQAQKAAGAISEATYITLVTDLSKKNYKEHEKKHKQGQDLSKVYEQLIKHATEYAAKINEETLELGMNEAAQYLYNAAKEAAKVEGTNEADDIIKAAHAYVAKRRAVTEAAAAEKAAAEMQSKFDKGAADVWEQVRALEHQLETYDMVEHAVIDLAATKVRAQLQSAELTAAETNALESQLAALEKLRDLTYKKELRDNVKQAAVDARQAWEKTAEKISDTLTDALMRGFESGKGFARNLRDTVVNMFKTMILRTTIQAGINGAIGSFGGGGGAGGVAGGIMQGASLVNAGSTLWGGLSGGMASSVGGMVAGAGNFTGIAALSEFGAGMQGATLASGLAGPTTAGAGGAMGAGSAFATAMPYLAAAAAIYAIVKSLDDSGTPHAGGASRADQFGVAGIDARSLGTMTVQSSEQTQKLTDTLAGGISTILNSTATALGKNAAFAVSTAFADDSSKDGAWGALRIERDGKKLLDWDDTRASRWAPREFGDGEAGYKQYTAALAGSVREALDSIGLPAWAQTMLDGLGNAPTIEQLGQTIDKINAAQQAFINIGGAIKVFADQSEAARSALVKASGGVEPLVAGLNAFYDGYYTEGEKVANMSRQIKESLAAVNLTMPTTRAEYRAMVEQQIALGESGAQAAAVLLKLSGVFGTVADFNNGPAAVEKTVEKTKTAAELAQEAYDALERSVNAEKKAREAAHKTTMDLLQTQRDATQKNVDKYRALSDATGSTLRGMRAPGQGENDYYAAQAQIMSAVAIARAGGALPDVDDLNNALSIVAQPSENLFNSFEDYQRNFYQTAIAIDELNSMSTAALTIEEQTLKVLEDTMRLTEQRHNDDIARLDAILESAQREIDAINGVRTDVQSLSVAIAGFNQASRAAGGSGSVSAGGVTGVSNAMSASEKIVQGLYGSLLNRTGEAEGVAYWTGRLNSGASAGQVEAEMKNSIEWIAKNSPGFANGGSHAGGWRMVGERGPELAFTGPEHILNNDRSAALFDMAGVERRLDDMGEFMQAALFQIARNTGDTRDTLQKFDIDGMPIERTEETA